MKLPLIGLGTYEMQGTKCTKAVKQALDIGYRHIDTAHLYENHKAVGKGIQGFDRSKLFITSKFTLRQINPKKVAASVEKTCDQALKDLGTDYLDLYLIHWPDLEMPMSKIFEAMEKLVDKGKILKAGVSNFTIHHLQDLKRDGFVPAANQVEFHPYLYQKPLLDYCRKMKIELIAYRPLGKGEVLKEPLLRKIGARHKKGPAQVVLRWLTQKKIPAIPKASSKKHLEENLESLDFKLSAAEMKIIDRLHQGTRFCKPGDPRFDY